MTINARGRPAATRSLAHRPVRFLLVGATGAAVNMGVLWAATRLGGLAAFWAGVAAAVISTGTNFVLNDLYTWRDRRVRGVRPVLGRLLRYYSTTALGNLVYLGVLTALVQWAHIFDLLANLIAIGVGGTFNYVLHNLWTWGRIREA